MSYVGLYNGYPIHLSTNSNNKYMVKVNNKFIHFGSRNYQHYRDKMKYYSYLDHNDPIRRQKYLTRSAGIKDKHGNLTYNNINSSNYWSRNVFW